MVTPCLAGEEVASGQSNCRSCLRGWLLHRTGMSSSQRTSRRCSDVNEQSLPS